MPYDVQVTIDSQDPHTLAEWWAETLGWEKEPPDSAFVQRMIDEGYATEDDTTTYKGAMVWKAGAGISRPDGLSPRILFQLVPETKSVKNRVHLDLRIGPDDLDATVERLVARGARVLHHGQQGPSVWVTITDPEGNELCVSK